MFDVTVKPRAGPLVKERDLRHEMREMLFKSSLMSRKGSNGLQIDVCIHKNSIDLQNDFCRYKISIIDHILSSK
jgi:hypothetical protein